MEKSQIPVSFPSAVHPATVPPAPASGNVDLFAALRPAKEVGNDFCDVMMLAEDRLALMIGDASGEGLAATAFIAAAHRLMRTHAGQGGGPAECLAYANAALCVGNHSMMFATAFMAVLDLRHGRAVYASAGHNPPFLRRAEGAVSRLDRSEGTALGVVGDMVYTDAGIHIRPHDTLLLYSDGATEAVSRDGRMFGDARVIHRLRRSGTDDARTIVGRLLADIDRFAQGAGQADDIALLCLRRLSKAPSIRPAPPPRRPAAGRNRPPAALHIRKR